jgi:predicted nucleotide-binding protein (sugar kinase/HSP70/actin superfamily)
VPLVADAPPKFQITAAQKKRAELMKKRSEIRIGMPRVLNMYSQTPVFTGYFASLGIKAENIVYSDYTSEELYKEGAKRGAIDPCFPSKLGIPHVHNLLYKVHAKKPLDIIFFPMIDCLTSPLHSVQASRSCPTVATTPEAVKAAFTKEGDLFAEKGVLFLDTFVNLSKPDLLERQLYTQFKDLFGLSPEENKRAVEEGYRALSYFDNVTMRGAAREVLEQLEREDRLGVVLLGRPYHNDPGVNHEILEEFQKLGYPVFAQDCLPIDDDMVWRLFGEDVEAGEIAHPMAITDVWKNSYSENTSRKVWAAKYVARHPNLVALELSSFKCGHDAPIYTVVEEIVEHSGTPYFCFKDIDENKPTGSIKIRVETIGYFLKRYREDMVRNKQKANTIEAAQGIRGPSPPPDAAREAGVGGRPRLVRDRLDAADPRQPRRARGQQAVRPAVRDGSGRLNSYRLMPGAPRTGRQADAGSIPVVEARIARGRLPVAESVVVSAPVAQVVAIPERNPDPDTEIRPRPETSAVIVAPPGVEASGVISASRCVVSAAVIAAASVRSGIRPYVVVAAAGIRRDVAVAGIAAARIAAAPAGITAPAVRRTRVPRSAA